MRTSGVECQLKCVMSPFDLINLTSKLKLSFSLDAIKFLINQIIGLIGIEKLQHMINKLALDGKILWKESFDVEKILDHINLDGIEYYKVKWLGWSDLCNTWEPVSNLDCPEKLLEYHGKPSQTAPDEVDNTVWIEILIEHFVEDCGLLKELAKEAKSMNEHKSYYKDPNFIKRGFGDYVNRKIKYHQISLKRTERYFRNASNSTGDIYIENMYDLETIPKQFCFINESFLSNELGKFEPMDKYCCECEDCSRSILECPCVNYKGSYYAYTTDGCCFLNRGSLIYECGPNCKCYANCPNKVVQNGRKMDLCLFKTSTGRGWGVKSCGRIKKGAYVTEYVGEIVTDQIAEDRGVVYDSERMSYLFDMDFENNGKPYVVDAKNYGNISRFINHSCDPNLHVLSTWCGSRDQRIYKISLFARRNIEPDEELTFDYFLKANDGNSPQQTGIRCLCMAKKCKKILF